MAFGPGGAYFLTGASNAAASAGLANSGAVSKGPSGDYGGSAPNGQRSASLPANLPPPSFATASAPQFQGQMPGLQEGASPALPPTLALHMHAKIRICDLCTSIIGAGICTTLSTLGTWRNARLRSSCLLHSKHLLEPASTPHLVVA